jgi:hypothetical protein
MNGRKPAVTIVIAALALSGASASAQEGSQPGVEAQTILTVADHMNHKPPAIKPEDVTIMNAAITDWIPPANGSDLDLFILIDDAANYDFGSKLQELRRFVIAQPAPVSIGVAYIHDGALRIAENPSNDHARAASALRAPSGSKTANPYCALSDLIQRWQQKSVRREIVLVSAGIDDSTPQGATCSDAETAIHDAERAGVVVYALYNPAADYRSEKWEKVDAGVVYLAHLCYESGGEAYFMSHDPVESIQPFLADVAEHLAHQYLVKFRISPRAESGFRPVYFSSASVTLELMAPSNVWVLAPGE